MGIKEITEQFIEQLDSILEYYDSLKSKWRHDDLSDLGETVAYEPITRSRAAIERISGRESAYFEQLQEILRIERKYVHDFSRLAMIIGIVRSLRADLQAGYLSSASELIRGELFADFLEMAEYLLEEGYKDAAAVIAGGTLEAHLRQLCTKNDIAVNIVTPKGSKAKRAEQMNTDLYKNRVYSKLD
jgi:tRNA(Glu) U13 pseudouridine synthase TruD